MNQWERYDVEMLLDIADSTNAPDEHEGARVTFRAVDGWKVAICYEACGDLDYIEHFIAPDGEIVDFWKWPVPDYGYLDPRYDDSPRGRLIAWQGVRRPTGNGEYIDEHRTRYYPLSAEAHFLLQRRLEVAQEALKPFAKRADWLDQTAGWRAANRRTSLVALSAMMHARDVLLEQKVWDRLPGASAAEEKA